MEGLERINREIELVKIEVEEEQKRLFQFILVFEELLRSFVVFIRGISVREDFFEGSLFQKDKREELFKNREGQFGKYAGDYACSVVDFECDFLFNYFVGSMGIFEVKQGDIDIQYFCYLKKFVGENCYKFQESQRFCVLLIRIKINF